MYFLCFCWMRGAWGLEKEGIKEGSDVQGLVDMRICHQSSYFRGNKGPLGSLLIWMVLATKESSFSM